MTGVEGRPRWWTPRLGEREVLVSLAATPGPLPAAVATWLAAGRDPASLLHPYSPDPASVVARLDALGVRLLLPGDHGWPLAATPPDPPCAWLFDFRDGRCVRFESFLNEVDEARAAARTRHT